MFNFEMPGQKRSFMTTTILVSVTTYIVAAGLLYGVGRRREKGSLRRIFKDRTRSAKTDPRTGSEDGILHYTPGMDISKILSQASKVSPESADQQLPTGQKQWQSTLGALKERFTKLSPRRNPEKVGVIV